ncbi:MAG TPA: hypothetical protein VGC44_00975 [Longimicrobiales bacterium]
MDETATRFWQELMARPSGPLAFRFVLQPLVAITYALRDGVRDAKTGRPAYFWAIFTDREHRKALIASGWQSIGKVLIIALAIDLIYQLIALRALRPLEAVFIAVLLAIVPYILVRGPINRILG